MKSISKILVATFVLLSSISCNAQNIKNKKSVTVRIYGNCGMCETTIEKAGNMKKQSIVDWDKETKMATISYDSLKTSKEEILKRIALVGYDNDAFLAPNDAYSGLPRCCQYERAELEKAPKEMEMNAEHSNMKVDEKKNNMEEVNPEPLKPVFDSYFEVKNALVSTDGESASTNAKDLLISINKVKMDELSMDVHMAWMKFLENLKENAEHIASTQDIENQRNYFIALSENMYNLLKVSEYSTPVFYQHCPMANDGKGGNWLSIEETVKNPYYGSVMLSCGKTIETIKN